MAAVTIRELLTKLGVDADTAAVQQYDKAVDLTKTTMLAAAAAATVLAGALIGVTVATANQGDEAAKAGARVGVTAEEMQELGFAAEQTGAKLIDVETAFRRQARAASDAAKGTGRAAETYRDLGINVKDAGGEFKAPLDLFLETAEAMKGLSSETEKSAIANDLFGRGGAKILPLINAGAEGINNLRDQAQDLGFVLDNEAAKASEDFVDRQNEVRLALVGVRNQIGKRLMPVLTDMLAGFRDFIVVNRDVIRQRIDKNMERITAAVELLQRGFEKVDEVVRERLGGWGNIFQQIEKAATFSGLLATLTVVIRLAKAATLAFGAMSAAGAPVVIAMAAVALAVIGATLAIEDLIVFARGGESAIGKFLEAFDPQMAEELRATLNELGAELMELGAIFEEIGLPLEELGALAEFILVNVILGSVRRLNQDLRMMIGLFQLVPRSLEELTSGSALLEGIRERGGAFLGRESERMQSSAQQRFGAQQAGQVAAGVAAAAAPALVGGASATTVNQGGDNITMNITGASEAEMVAMMDRLRVERNRRAIAAAAGGER
jgi:hypothetical protein